jgi:hypothetical protein
MDPKPIKAHYKHLTIKNNPYNSNPMALFLTKRVSCHTIQFSLHRILHACFHNFIILPLITYFHKIEFTVIRRIFHVSCKHACFDKQNNHVM